MTDLNGRYDLLCDEVREALSSAIEDDTRSSENQAVARHLVNCAACAAFNDEMRELDQHLQEHLCEKADLDQIWARISTSIDAESSTGNRGLPSRSGSISRRGVLGWGAGAAALASVPLGMLLWPKPENQGQSFIAAVVDDFMDYQQSDGTLDFQAAHPSVVRRWMAARVDFNLPTSLSAPLGAQLAGGRLCSVYDRKLAFFAYRSPADAVGLYVTPASGLEFSPSDQFSATARDDGLTTVAWQRDGLGYVVVSGAPIGALDGFIKHFRRSVT